MAMLWVKFQEQEMENGRIPEEERTAMTERLRILRSRLGDESDLLDSPEPPVFKKLREDRERIEKEGDGSGREEGDKDSK